jgi:hypothetical protein
MGGKQINIMEAIVDVIKELQREESEDVYTSFLRMLALLTAAHTPKAGAKCVLIYTDGDAVITMGANTDEFEMVGLIDTLHKHQMEEVMADAPPKEMFN